MRLFVRLVFTSLMCFGSACADSDGSEDTEGSSASGTSGSNDGSSGNDGSGAPATSGGSDTSTYVRGVFNGIDGQSEAFESGAYWSDLTFDGMTLAHCSAQDVTDFELGVSYRPDQTSLGTYDLDLTEGPYFVLGWPQADGTGFHGTAASNGTVTFTEFGTAPGDVVAGEGEVVLSPEPDDPDDLYESVTEIEFRCIVPDA